MKKLMIGILVLFVFGRVLYANQDLLIPKTRLEYITPERTNFDEKIQYGLEEII